MPSPIGHALAGLIVHVAFSDRRDLSDWPRAAIAAGAACAPDLDLLLGVLSGRSQHRTFTHGIGAAVLCGLAAVVAARLLRWPRPEWLGSIVALAWASHLILDLLGSDTHAPFGIMALWPIDPGWYKAPVVLFPDIGRTLSLSTVRQNAIAAAWEIVLLLPVLSGALWIRQRKS